MELNEELLVAVETLAEGLGRRLRFVAGNEELACPDYADLIGTGQDPDRFDFAASIPKLKAAPNRRSLQSRGPSSPVSATMEPPGPSTSPTASSTATPTKSPTPFSSASPTGRPL